MSEKDVVEDFLSEFFESELGHELENLEERLIDEVLSYVTSRFSKMKYILGLAVDFLLLAQEMSQVDSNLLKFRAEFSEKDFEKYEQVGENTLTLKHGGRKIGIRKFEEKVVEFYHSLYRTNYPSAYVYNTGQWRKYKDLLVLCFKLSKSGRKLCITKLLNFGLISIKKNSFFSPDTTRSRIFERIILDYDRAWSGENGGLVMQAIAYGFISTDRPHLDLIVDKVRTGSSRQARFGDLDCYYGLNLEVSIEVKDIFITAENIKKQLGSFISKVETEGVQGIIFVSSIDADIRARVESSRLIIIDLEMLVRIVNTWDWVKQDRAFLGILHYLSHVEQNSDAASRLLKFVSQFETKHPVVQRFSNTESQITADASEV